MCGEEQAARRAGVVGEDEVCELFRSVRRRGSESVLLDVPVEVGEVLRDEGLEGREVL